MISEAHGSFLPRQGNIFTSVCQEFCTRGGGHAWWGVCMAREGVHGRGGACVAGKTAIAAGGTHPTGMHPFPLF